MIAQIQKPLSRRFAPPSSAMHEAEREGEVKYTTRELITELLECDMDAEISIDADVMGELKTDEGVEISEIKTHDCGFEKFTIIKLGKLS